MTRGPLLVVGASGRAAAASAIRAGFEPTVIDLFADADTGLLCEVRRCAAGDYPRGLIRSAARRSDVPVMYTGGLENHPDLIDRVAAVRPLWGTAADALRLLRDPFALADWLKLRGRRYAPVRSAADGPPRSGTWVRKPIAGSGGLGVRLAAPGDGPLPDTHYLQRFVPGRPMSAVFVSYPRRCQIIGVTEQLVGTDWLHADGFRYAGSVGPTTVGYAVGEQLRQLAFAVIGLADVRGLWGLDFVLTGGRVVPIEVNPRYPASAEVIELATGDRLIARHAEAFADGDRHWDAPRPCRVVGKAIYYAARRITFPSAYGEWTPSVLHTSPRTVWRRPDYADVPAAGTVIEHGHPVLTILAEAETRDACVAKLREKARLLDKAFRVKSKGAAP